MYAAIGWTVLGMIIGAIVGVFSVALVAARRHGEIAELKRANVRLIADVARASVNNTELERRLRKAQFESDNWQIEATKNTNAFKEAWQDKMPGDAE